MKELIQSEWERLLARRVVRNLVIMMGLITFITIYFLTMYDNGQFTSSQNTKLNAVNFPWFVLREVSFYITLLLMPIVTMISVNSEVKTNVYNMVLSRPFKRLSFLMAKWFSLLKLGGILTVGILSISIVAGFLLYDMPSRVFLFQQSEPTTILGGYLYTLQFYGVFYIILIAAILISSCVALWVNNPMLAFLIYILLCGAPVYFTDAFLFMLLPTQSIFISLAESGISSIYGFLAILIIGFGMGTLVRWERYDFK
ncbi:MULTISPECIES: hypothetical protein [Pontibacillus]|uniref:ABC transporter permease n=1 Tax=Pontibacillus chungwhensis TaxID=265426 RepID=A0ABY8USP5_9BACI|nr:MULTISPECIES: hypothetical protein [Pontibacillus]MCD5323315.1 hypothetical protein [Pontibacillus sp. HN14]WIF96696.1 hypothetical protein QNI29_13160 [Pontibacillus chungwhensis]